MFLVKHISLVRLAHTFVPRAGFKEAMAPMFYPKSFEYPSEIAKVIQLIMYDRSHAHSYSTKIIEMGGPDGTEWPLRSKIQLASHNCNF